MMIKALKIFLVTFLLFVPRSYAQITETSDAAVYDALLHQYVQGNRVDFSGVCKDPRLGQYLGGAAQTDPDKFSDPQERLAFWINVYNAYNLKVICDKYPVKSMLQLGFGPILVQAALGKTVWDKPIAVVSGKKYTLKNIDHSVIRGKFHDPKIQFALYCGAVACPPLRNEAYDAKKLQEQLFQQAMIFFGNKEWNTFDLSSKSATLSSIMNWNAKYFGGDRDAVLRFIGQFAPSDVRDSLKDEPGAWKVTYNEYDLTVNDATNK